MEIPDINLWMFGTFVPIQAGHLPIDFFQENAYDLYERYKKIRKTEPSTATQLKM